MGIAFGRNALHIEKTPIDPNRVCPYHVSSLYSQLQEESA